MQWLTCSSWLLHHLPYQTSQTGALNCLPPWRRFLSQPISLSLKDHMPSMKSAAVPTPELAECANLQQVSEDFPLLLKAKWPYISEKRLLTDRHSAIILYRPSDKLSQSQMVLSFSPRIWWNALLCVHIHIHNSFVYIYEATFILSA